MISLLDSDDVPVDLFLPPLVALLFPPLLVTEIDFVFFHLQNYVLLFFSKTQFAMQLPAEKKNKTKQKKNRVATQVECGISQWPT